MLGLDSATSKRPCIPAKPAGIERKFRNVLLENESDQQDHVEFVWKTHNKPWERTYHTASTDVEALLQLTAEGSFYQDIQYLNVHDAIEPDKQPIQILVDDEYVDRHKLGETIRINGVVYIDPIADRNFVKDTRRILQVRALSIEEVS